MFLKVSMTDSYDISFKRITLYIVYFETQRIKQFHYKFINRECLMKLGGNLYDEKCQI